MDVLWPSPFGNRRQDRLHQLARGAIRFHGTPIADELSYTGRPALVGVFPKEIGQLSRRKLVQPICCRGCSAGRVHPHIERSLRILEGKSATSVIELTGRHAQIEKHTIDLRKAFSIQQRANSVEPSVQQENAGQDILLAALRETNASGFDRFFVLIDPDQRASGAKPLPEQQSMASAA